MFDPMAETRSPPLCCDWSAEKIRRKVFLHVDEGMLLLFNLEKNKPIAHTENLNSLVKCIQRTPSSNIFIHPQFRDTTSRETLHS